MSRDNNFGSNYSNPQKGPRPPPLTRVLTDEVIEVIQAPEKDAADGDGKGDDDDDDDDSIGVFTPPGPLFVIPGTPEKINIKDKISASSSAGTGGSSAPDVFFFAQPVHKKEPDLEDECCCRRSRRFCTIFWIIFGAIIFFVLIPIFTTFFTYRMNAESGGGDTTTVGSSVTSLTPPQSNVTNSISTTVSINPTTLKSTVKPPPGTRLVCNCNVDGPYKDDHGVEHENGDAICGLETSGVKSCGRVKSYCYTRTYKNRPYTTEKSCIPAKVARCKNGQCRMSTTVNFEDYSECYCDTNNCNDRDRCQCWPRDLESDYKNSSEEEEINKAHCRPTDWLNK